MVRVTHVADLTDIEIGPRLDPAAEAVLKAVHQGCHVRDGVGVLECREHDDNPRLTHLRGEDGRVNGAWCYVQRRRDKWIICHSPRGVAGGIAAHEVPTGMSDQHRWQADYWQRSGQDAGYDTAQEVTLPGTRLDVVIAGDVTVGVEVQHSNLSRRKVLARTRKAGQAGVTAIWSADRRQPDWAFKVPHVETNELPHSDTPRGSWTVVTGPRRFVRVACSPKNADLLAQCQKPRSRNWCGGYHPVWWPIDGLVVDDIAAQAPAGQLVRLDTGTKQGVVLVTPAQRDLWLAEIAPSIRSPREERTAAARQTCDVIPAHLLCAGCKTEPRGFKSEFCARCYFHEVVGGWPSSAGITIHTPGPLPTPRVTSNPEAPR